MEEQVQLYLSKYGERMIAVCDILDVSLPSGCSYQRPQGGYFIWIKLPETVDGAIFNEFCLKNYSVVAISGARFSAVNQFKNFIRLTIGFHEKDVMIDGVTKVCEALKVFLKK